jgi:acyl-CoA synthetase (AMP-forming)/AMP-acid ligase II
LLPLLEAPLELTFRNNVGHSATALEFQKQPRKFTPVGVILLAEKSKFAREQIRELRNFLTDVVDIDLPK